MSGSDANLGRCGVPCSYSGGSGATIEDAVIVMIPAGITGSVADVVGVVAEYAWLEDRYGPRDQAWKFVMQRLLDGPEGRHYDCLTSELEDRTRRDIYFDISNFFMRKS